MVAEVKMHLLVPLRQYEVALQNASKVLESLLKRPARPWVCFDRLLQDLSGQVAAMRRKAAACRVQRAFRKYRVRQAERQAEQQGRQKVGCVDFRREIMGGSGAPPARKGAATPTQSAAPAGQSAGLAGPGQLPSPRPGAPADPRPPLLSVITADGAEKKTALNPIEKRRQMVATQLAMANPKRLARCHRTRPATMSPAGTRKVPESPRELADGAAAPEVPSSAPRQPQSELSTPRELPHGSGTPRLSATSESLLLRDGQMDLRDGESSCGTPAGVDCNWNDDGIVLSAGVSMAPPPADSGRGPTAAPAPAATPSKGAGRGEAFDAAAFLCAPPLPPSKPRSHTMSPRRQACESPSELGGHFHALKLSAAGAAASPFPRKVPLPPRSGDRDAAPRRAEPELAGEAPADRGRCDSAGAPALPRRPRYGSVTRQLSACRSRGLQLAV